MSKTVKIIVAVIVVIMLAGGAYMLLNKDDKTQVDNKSPATPSSIEKTAKPEQQVKSKITTVDGAIAELKKAGLTVSEKQGAYYQVIGADKGDKVDVDGTNVEMYEFSKEPKAQEAVNQLKGDDNTAYAKGSFVVLIHSTDPALISKIQNIL